MATDRKTIKADYFISLGTKCAITWNLRRYYGTKLSFPMDWWVTPLGAIPSLIRNGFEADVRNENLEIVGANESVINRRFSILHHHDFPRDHQERIRDDWRKSVDEARARNLRRAERLRRVLRESSTTVLFLDWVGVHAWTAEPFREMSFSPEIYTSIYDSLQAEFPKSTL